MNNSTQWIDHFASPYLFKWNEHESFITGTKPFYEGDNHKVWMNSQYEEGIPNKAVYDPSQVKKKYGPVTFESSERILLSWLPEDMDNITKPVLFNPESLLLVNMNRFLNPNNINVVQPTTTIGWLSVTWSFDKTHPNVLTRPGPIHIAISEYKEYWKDGVFIKRDWDSMKVNWTGDLSTSGPPDWSPKTKPLNDESENNILQKKKTSGIGSSIAKSRKTYYIVQ